MFIRLAMNPYSSPLQSSLVRALALSLVLHAAVVVLATRLWMPSTRRTPEAALKVRLVEPLSIPASTPAPQPELLMREDTPRKAITPPLQKPLPRLTRAPEAPRRADVQVLAGDAARKAGEQIARELFYPPEAIERGLEGEALVLLFLDESGSAIAARIETSSGHAILDAAAVRAARTLKSLPASAPREALLPVRFRLR